MFGCLHVSDSDLRHPTAIFSLWDPKNRMTVNLDESRQNIGKVEKIRHRKLAVRCHEPHTCVRTSVCYICQHIDMCFIKKK